MGKRQLCLYIEDELIKIAIKRDLNLSQEFNTYLKARILGIESTKPSDLENIDRLKMDLENQSIAINRQIEELVQKKGLLIKKEDDEIDKRLEELTS
jgi:hypothetical protein